MGTLTAIYCIGIDLSSPFVGTYVVAADQLLDEAEDLLTLIRETSTKSVPEPNGGAGGISVGGHANGAVAYPKPSSPKAQQPSAHALDVATNGSAEASAEPMEAVAMASDDSHASSFDRNSPNQSNSNPATEEYDLGQPLEQATSYEEYMRRRQRGEY